MVPGRDRYGAISAAISGTRENAWLKMSTLHPSSRGPGKPGAGNEINAASGVYRLKTGRVELLD